MAHRSSKEQVYEYLEQITKEFDFEHLTRYTTLDICNKLNMSRSLVSLYLNELVKEDTVIKISSRPVYYLNRAGLNVSSICSLPRMSIWVSRNFRVRLRVIFQKRRTLKERSAMKAA